MDWVCHFLFTKYVLLYNLLTYSEGGDSLRFSSDLPALYVIESKLNSLRRRNVKRNLYVLLSLLVVASVVLAGCGGAAPATEAPVATEPPATEAPATEAPSAYEGMLVESPDCDYGGEFKSIEAVDEFTVKFTLCAPDPAFLSKVAFGVFAIQDSDYLTANGGDSAKMSEAPN